MATDPTNLKELSGPMYVIGSARDVHTSETLAFSGPLYVNTTPTGAVDPRTPPDDFSGPVYVSMLTPGHFIYDLNADFARWGGSYTTYDNNMYPVLNGSSPVIAYGPVETSTMGSAAGICTAKVWYANPTTDPTGQDIYLSIRASNTQFLPTDTTVPWSSWWRYTDVDNLIQAIGGGGSGNYVQVRAMWTPGTTATTSALTVFRIDIWATATANSEATGDIDGQIYTGHNQVRSFQYGQIDIRFPGLSDILAKIDVQYVATDSLIPAQIYIHPAAATSDIVCSIGVHQNGSSDIPCQIGFPVHGSATSDILAQIDIIEQSYLAAPVMAQIYVRQNATSDVPSQISVVVHLIPCQITIQTPNQTSDIPCQIYMRPDVPGPVTNLTANVPNGVYTTTSSITFTWGPATAAITPVGLYAYMLDVFPTSAASATWTTTDTNPADMTASYDLTQAGYGTADYYFHVAARNTADDMGPVTTYAVFYNHPPTQPGGSYMRLNGVDTIATHPIISASTSASNVLSWSPSTDVDNDALTYEVQVASESDFGLDPRTEASSIVIDATNVPSNLWVVTPMVKSGSWFWRTRGYDGKQYSAWSQTGGFVVNSPPGRVTGLLVQSY